MGFTQAAALLIIASQLPALLGASGTLSAWLAAPHLHGMATLYGLLSVALLVLGKRWWPRLPMMVFLVGGACALSAWSGFSQQTALVIGALPAGLPALSLPALPAWDTLTALLVPAMVIALVSFLETASSAKVEAQRDGRQWQDNQDLMGQGLGKLASALCGSFPTSSSFSRSAINLYAGARTGWATVIMVGFVLLALLVLTPVLFHVPKAVLSGVVIVAVMGLLQPLALIKLWRISRVEATTALITFAVTLLTAPRIHWGVLAGVLLSLTHFLYQHLHPRIIEIGLHPDGSLRDRHLWKLPPLAPHLYALRMDDELDFASSSAFERAISEHLAAHPDVRHVCLFAQPINRIDVTGVQTLAQLINTLHERGIALHISGIKLPVETALRKAGVLNEHPLLRMYRVDADTLQALASLPAENRA
jgi:sulfate permease, SulP family